MEWMRYVRGRFRDTGYCLICSSTKPASCEYGRILCTPDAEFILGRITGCTKPFGQKNRATGPKSTSVVERLTGREVRSERLIERLPVLNRR